MKYNKHKDLEYWRGVFEKFKKENGKYPTSEELKGIRSIQRYFGGIKELRKLFKIENYSDRKDIAKEILKRATLIEQNTNTYLIKLFGERNVHREQPIFENSRVRLDFLVFFKNCKYALDVFYPKSRRSLYGCLNCKMKKFEGKEMFQFPMMFVCMNDDLKNDLMEYKESSGILKKYENKYNVKIMSREEMEKYFEDIIK